MERPLFVVLRKAFHALEGYDVAFCPDGGDVRLFFSYDSALKDALAWCNACARDVETVMSLGEISKPSAQYADIVAQIVGYRCFDKAVRRVSVEILQKYVL